MTTSVLWLIHAIINVFAAFLFFMMRMFEIFDPDEERGKCITVSIIAVLLLLSGLLGFCKHTEAKKEAIVVSENVIEVNYDTKKERRVANESYYQIDNR